MNVRHVAGDAQKIAPEHNAIDLNQTSLSGMTVQGICLIILYEIIIILQASFQFQRL